ncbi:serine hydrolase domain-containing protein [Maribacter sp. 2-571]|uniref:serine hydrolase domain-containing protein n=1 Tax=Maribacter sp. 2-571 TaxID=3417569 RepID=UPI003D34A173
MNTNRKLFLLLFLGIQIGTAQTPALEQTFDTLVNPLYEENGPGLVVLVAKEDVIHYRKAFGMADLELQVPMRTDHVFEIGSMTKQFTAVCLLMLKEQGKLTLDDTIGMYLPDYPLAGRKVTLHQLLNHTSGIKSYTEMPGLNVFARQDKTPTELIDHFKNEPMDFEPGTQWHYSNSGYVILGFIIEKVSGMAYADFVRQHIFEPLGMHRSYYGSKTELIPNRASGYMPTKNGYRNADYLSMSLPYAAGSLMSCVDDMFLWFQAIRKNTLITTESKALAFADTVLPNGKSTHYGYGWQRNEILGTPTVEHGGGIFGYVAQGVYVPESEIYVVVLTNRNGNSPQNTAIRLAAHAMGTPFPKSGQGISLKKKQLQRWTGTYVFDEGVPHTITMVDGSLYRTVEGEKPSPLFPISQHEFYRKNTFDRYVFEKGDGVKTVRFSQRIVKKTGAVVN